MKNNKKCAFTICAKNYIGLSLILETSFKIHNPDVDFYIFVADQIEEQLDLPSNILIAFDCFGDKLPWLDMSFKYDLTEFCTSIKPSCFKYLFKDLNYDKAIYLDPDIYIFNSFDEVYTSLDNYSIILTPHICQIQDIYTGDTPERNLLASGVFNLGFCALKKSDHSIKFLYWWGNRLLDKCFANFPENFYTDQKWIDMTPCFFPSDILHISNNIGLNVAPWNFFEREIIIKNSDFFVDFRTLEKSDPVKLVFVHYSGYNYSKLIEGQIYQKNIPNLSEFIDIDIILDVYKKAIIDMLPVFNKYIHLKYSYNFFYDGSPITLFQRRLYHGINESEKIYKNPFSIEKGTFYYELKKNKFFPKKIELEKYGKETPSVKSKIGKINKFFTLLYRILGYDRFYLLIRLFKPYSKFEIYSFLIRKRNEQ